MKEVQSREQDGEIINWTGEEDWKTKEGKGRVRKM